MPDTTTTRASLQAECEAIDAVLDAHEQTCGCDDDGCESVTAIQVRIDGLRESMRRAGLNA